MTTFVVIPADALLKEIDTEALPMLKEKAVLLPGAQGENLVSFPQQRQIAVYAKAHFAAAMTWGEAVVSLRKQFCIGHQSDFHISDAIGSVNVAARALDPLSPNQERAAWVYIRALEGDEPHWFAPFQVKIEATRMSVRLLLADEFQKAVSSNEQGPFNRAIKSCEMRFGRMPVVAQDTPMADNVDVPDDPSSLIGDDHEPF